MGAMCGSSSISGGKSYMSISGKKVIAKNSLISRLLISNKYVPVYKVNDSIVYSAVLREILRKINKPEI